MPIANADPAYAISMRWRLTLSGRKLIVWVHRLVLLVGVVLAATCAVALSAHRAAAADWQPTGLGEPASMLFTPASGAFFAKTASGLSRSDDGGASWHAVPL